VTLSENGEHRIERKSSLKAIPNPEHAVNLRTTSLIPFFLASLAPIASQAVESDDMAAVAALDTQYQAAVKANDGATMARILADDFILVIGNGSVSTKADLLKEAADRVRIYEHQEDTEQTVRIWGDTAVVTAKLWLKGTRKGGAPFDYTLWFSDTYARMPSGWRYVFGQASLPLPKPQ
jgi:ketosteroid isomerase-like protein